MNRGKIRDLMERGLRAEREINRQERRRKKGEDDAYELLRHVRQNLEDIRREADLMDEESPSLIPICFEIVGYWEMIGSDTFLTPKETEYLEELKKTLPSREEEENG